MKRILGYCGKCGSDVVVDFCERCQRYVQPSPHEAAVVERKLRYSRKQLKQRKGK